ncbi:MAG TPA: hypothetical protein VF613_22540 [Longimicrobium sp.]
MVAGVAALSSACASGPVSRVYSSPAPATALECSLRTMAGLGYNPVQGGVSDGYIKFDRRTNVSTGAAMGSMLPGVRRPADGSFVTVTSAAGSMRVAVTSYRLDGSTPKEDKPSAEAMGHAEAIVATCGNPATHSVQGNPTP